MRKILNTFFSKSEKGFTLIEMMVVLAIFLLISGITLANYPAFNSRVSISTLANGIAVSIREAQVYGVSVKNATTSTSSLGLYPSYGVYFNTATGNSQASTTQYVFFYDQQESGMYNTYGKPIGDGRYNTTTEKVQAMGLSNGNRIVRIYGKQASDATAAQACNDNKAGYTCAIGAHISFKRPNPDAKICMVTGTATWPLGTGTCGTTEANTARVGELHIIVQSKDGNYTKDIVVYSSGQVTIQ